MRSSLVTSKGAGTQSDAVLQTTTAPMLTGTFQTVNGGFGDQTDPHIDCNRASYTNDDFFGALSIRYFDFATNTDQAIPGNGTDVLSDVFGGTIALTEATPSGPQVVLFDTATQARTVVPGSKIVIQYSGKPGGLRDPEFRAPQTRASSWSTTGATMKSPTNE